MRPGTVVVGLALFSPGCHDGGDDGGETELRIAVAPVDDVTLDALFALDGTSPAGRPLTKGTGTLTLALGDDYPATVTVRATDLWDMQCGRLLGSFAITDVDVDGDAVDATLGDGRSIAVHARAPGDAMVTIRGLLTVGPEGIGGCARAYQVPDEVDVEVRELVRVRAPAGAELRRPTACATAEVAYVESGARLFPSYEDEPDALVAPIDADGEAFYPANATARQAVAVTVRASADTSLELAVEGGGLGALVVTGAPDTIVVESELDEIGRFESIDAGRITAMDVTFALPGFGAGPVTLESGATYGESGWNRTLDHVMPAITATYVGDDAICTRPRAQAFTLTSATVDRCLPRDPSPVTREHATLPYGVTLALSAELVGSGECDLTLHAPQYADGNGLAANLDVTLLEVELLRTLADSGR